MARPRWISSTLRYTIAGPLLGDVMTDQGVSRGPRDMRTGPGPFLLVLGSSENRPTGAGRERIEGIESGR